MDQLTQVIEVKIYNKVKNIINEQQINNQSIDPLVILNLVTVSMETVETYVHLNGEDKKQVVLNVLIKLINELPIDDSLKDIFILLISPLIELIVKAVDGKFKINKSTFLNLFKCCKKA